MKIAVHDADKDPTSHDIDFSDRKVFHTKNTFPNLALMKLSAWHKSQGDSVEWYRAYDVDQYDRVYSSKVFTFNKGDADLGVCSNPIKGGSGYGLLNNLEDNIEHIMPDYSLYSIDYSMGFLTRGCIRACPWCVVPKKEGKIRKHADIEEFAQHKNVVLLDNNVLAHKHGIAQLEKIAKLGLSVDFNQGMDARLIDDPVAKIMGKIKWLNAVRLACDDKAQMPSIRTAVEHLRWHNVTPRRYFCYVLVKDIEDALERIRFLKGLDLDPFAQPYIAPDGTPPTKEQKKFARWVNMKAAYKCTTWDEYKQESNEGTNG
jgi:hypothetical protein